MAEHPQWASAWTRAQIVSMLMRPFNWAAKKRLIASNPFRGVEVSRGMPRRPLTADEFRRLLKHALVRAIRKRSKERYPRPTMFVAQHLASLLKEIALFTESSRHFYPTKFVGRYLIL